MINNHLKDKVTYINKKLQIINTSLSSFK